MAESVKALCTGPSDEELV